MIKVLLGSVAILTATSAVAEDTVTWADDVEGWAVAVDRTIGNSCFLLTVFDTGQFVRFQFNNDAGTLQFIVGSMDWASVEQGRSYDLEVAFNDAAPWSGEGEGYHWQDIVPSLVLSLPMAETRASYFLNEFRGMADLRIRSEGTEIAHLSPVGTEAAVAELMSCQATMLANAAPADPFENMGAATGDL